MTKEEVFQKIYDWEIDNGESFVDYFGSNLRIKTFVFWCWGRGHLTVEQFNSWEDAGCPDDDDFIIGDTDEPYALCTLDAWEKGLEILAEFISESKTYMKRLEEFLNGKGWSVNYKEDECEKDE